jgi:hypothetical protein
MFPQSNMTADAMNIVKWHFIRFIAMAFSQDTRISILNQYSVRLSAYFPFKITIKCNL